MGTRMLGKDSKVIINDIEYCATDMSLESDIELNESSSGGTRGTRTYDKGLSGAVGTITANYKPENDPIPTTYPGEDITLSLRFDRADGVYQLITLPAIVNRLTWGSPVKGFVSFVISFTANGWDQEQVWPYFQSGVE